MSPSESLSEFQRHLLETLSQPLSPDEQLAQLQAAANLAEFQEYVESFQPSMIEVAAELVKKWGRISSATKLEQFEIPLSVARERVISISELARLDFFPRANKKLERQEPIR